MQIRPAEEQDIPAIHHLLEQVLAIHANKRPDLFVPNSVKYTGEDLKVLLRDPQRPIFVALDEDGSVVAHAFCEFQNNTGANNLTHIKTLYLDDLCVDEKSRGKGIGKALYEYVAGFAQREGCYRLTLHAWTLNPEAVQFYQHLGLQTYCLCMEQILNKDNH
ncbi:MAG: GNAT family N-acetyltransferase [Coriobacteriaceae bacterium]|jgi:GNAT superfamily N-acetyltransferase|nr:MAG: GNAT family N-acetyltransferase [Coriobacteriaceae bacterium]